MMWMEKIQRKTEQDASINGACERKDGMIDTFVCHHLGKTLARGTDRTVKQIGKLENGEWVFLLSGWNGAPAGHHAYVIVENVRNDSRMAYEINSDAGSDASSGSVAKKSDLNRNRCTLGVTVRLNVSNDIAKLATRLAELQRVAAKTLDFTKKLEAGYL
jgi:hypothetical protein